MGGSSSWFQIGHGKPVEVGDGPEPIWLPMRRDGRVHSPTVARLSGAPLTTRSPTHREGYSDNDTFLPEEFFVSIRTLGRTGPGKRSVGSKPGGGKVVSERRVEGRGSTSPSPNPNSHLSSLFTHLCVVPPLCLGFRVARVLIWEIDMDLGVGMEVEVMEEEVEGEGTQISVATINRGSSIRTNSTNPGLQ